MRVRPLPNCKGALTLTLSRRERGSEGSGANTDAYLRHSTVVAAAGHGDPALDLRLRSGPARAGIGGRRAPLQHHGRLGGLQPRAARRAGGAFRARQAGPRAIRELGRTDLHRGFRHLLADAGVHYGHLRPPHARHGRTALPDAVAVHPDRDWNGGLVGRAPQPARRLRHPLHHGALPRHPQLLAGHAGRVNPVGALALRAARPLRATLA